jgi:hypothetical protein
MSLRSGHPLQRNVVHHAGIFTLQPCIREPLNAEVRRIVWKYERYSCQQASNRTKEDAETKILHEITRYLLELSYRKTKRQRLQRIMFSCIHLYPNAVTARRGSNLIEGLPACDHLAPAKSSIPSRRLSVDQAIVLCNKSWVYL